MVKRWIAVGVTLLGCLMVVGCGVPEVELSFEAAEYVNEEHGFSVKYPKSWGQIPPVHETVVFQASGQFRGAGPLYYIPAVIIGVADIEEGVSFVEGWIAATKEVGYTYNETGYTNIEVVSESETALADGTPASVAIVRFTDNLGYLVDGFVLWVEKDGNFISVSVYTVNEFDPFSEEQMSEVAHTLRFE